MSAGVAVRAIPAARQLRRRAFSLGIARGVDHAIQLLLPIVLVRCLEPAAFGHYRLLWLVAGTALGVATLSMPASLFYFLPRSDDATQRVYVKQTLLFLAGAGLVAALCLAPWNPWLPDSMRGLAEHGGLVPSFLLLWIVASLLDVLPTADERVRWQARATVGLAILRAGALSTAAILTGDLGAVLWVLLGFVVIKVGVLLAYVAGFHGVRGPLAHWHLFSGQIRYAAPFGTGGALYMLRLHADQWIAATLFPVGAFAAFSIAAVLAPLLHVLRYAVSAAFLPSMSRLQARGDIAAALALNNRGNVLVGTLVYPLLSFVFVFAEDLITIVYTSAYVDAAPVMRVYAVGLIALVVELATLMQVLRQGLFILGLNTVALIGAVALSWFFAQRIGLAGAALGSVGLAFVDRALTLWRLSALTGIPIRHAQPWSALALLIALSMLAGAFAWAISDAWLEEQPAPLRVAAGGLALVCAYAALHRFLPAPLRKTLQDDVNG